MEGLIVVVLVLVGGLGYLGYKQLHTKGMSLNSQPASFIDTNSADYKNYMKYKGKDYDRYFIANMIAHHQGAFDMANLALTKAKHQEIKTLAQLTHRFCYSFHLHS